MRRVIVVVVLLAAAFPHIGASAEVVKHEVSFEVTNPVDHQPGDVTHTIRGTLTLPADAPECGSSVILLLHGLSYGRWAWDFPLEPETYSVADALAREGYASVAIDELGYDASGGDEDPDGQVNGYTPTLESLADITAQIVVQLRARFSHVALMGHSAGTAIAELAAGTYGGVDALIATAYTHFPSQRIASDFFTGDVPRALAADYEYFGADVAGRTEYMYHLPNAEMDVVNADNARANLTPSGEILTIAQQPSKAVMAAIDVPVLLVLAEHDLLFPPEEGANELLLFGGSPDVGLHVVPRAGHSFMLHRNAPETNAAIAGWLRARDTAVPSC